MSVDNKIFHKVFEFNAEKYRDNIAVECNGIKTDYDKLNRFANAVANIIATDDSSNPGDIVAVFMKSGFEYIASIIGIMKAGRVFMPLSTTMPPEAIKRNIAKTRPALIIKELAFDGFLDSLNIEELKSIHSISLADEKFSVGGGDFKNYTEYETGAPDVEVQPDDSCYLIFTSGSTGEPKAILGKHKSLSHFVHWECKEFHFDENTKIPLLAPVTFDVSFRDIFSPLLAGGRVMIPEERVKNNYKLFAEWLDEKEITALHIVPSLLRILIKEIKTGDSEKLFRSLKYVLSAGEPLYGRDVDAWREIFGSRIEIVNLYGPSETVLAKVFNRFGDEKFDPNRIIPLGNPISNASVLILDEGKLCDIGRMGEIYIKTPFRSNGYYNSPELNAASFIVNPLTNDPSDLIYKTGDMGKYLPDRRIEYIGRTDRQVKVYGNRVELGEIEYALNSMPEIDESVVISDKNHNYEVRLLAYYTLKSPLKSEEIRTILSKSLPDYMIPAYLIELESFPLNFNGKINKKALPKPEDLFYEKTPYVEPNTRIEKDLAELWSVSLGIKRVGVKNTYLEFGGNSLTAIKLISNIYKKFGAEINIRDLFENGCIESLARIIERSVKSEAAPFPKAPSKDFNRLSAQQKRIWIESQFESQSGAYNIPSAYMLEGDLDVDILEKSLNAIIERHDILRTAFVESEGEPRQVVIQGAAIKINRYKADDPNELLKNLSRRVFDISKAPLIDCSVIELSAQKFILVFNIHHLVTDGWSLRLMVKELNEIYRALRTNETYDLEAPEIHYIDFVYRQSAALESGEMKASRDYWLEKLSGDLDVLDMPEDFERPAVRTFTGSIFRKTLSGDAAEALEFLAEKHKTTKFAAVTTLIKVLLAYYSGQKDIIIGTVVAGRDHSALQNQQGFFSNTIPLRNEVNPGESFKDLIARINSCIIESMRHQDYPFDKLLEELSLEKDPSRNPLFDIMLIYRDEEEESLELEGIAAKELTLEECVSRLDMGIEFVEKSGVFNVEINYNDSIYKRETIESFTNHFERLILSAYSNPDRMVGEYDILDDAEIRRLINLNYEKADYDIEIPIHIQFSEIARKNPSKTAILHRTESVTYGELEKRSDDIAAWLSTEYGIKIGETVAVLCERGMDLIASLLGVLKASAVYMPLDPEFPTERIRYMLEASKCSTILTSRDSDLRAEANVVHINGVPGVESFEAAEINTINPAYIIFTSGTTGNPKGAVISHRGFLNSIHHQIKSYKYCSDDRALQFASHTFDGSLTEIFLALLSGSTLVIADRGIIDDTNEFMDYLAEKKVNRAYIPPSYLSLLDKRSLGLQTLLSAGESPVARDLYELAERTEVFNVYGPTEASCTASFYQVSPNESQRKRIPIGKPVANVNFLVMNSSMKLMPQGVAGEICIAGEGVGLGYINNSTDTVFVENPYLPGQKLYKSGDLGRLTADGNIEFLGRCDDQVKINGYRIEPAEIENAINNSKLVKKTAVALAGKGSEPKELIAFVVLTDRSETENFENELKNVLPRYLMPSRIEYRDNLPMTSNGKIDRKKLLADYKVNQTKTVKAKTSPQTATELAVSSFIKQILKIDSVYLEDNFFKIGGHSLAAIQLLSKINKEFNSSIALAEIFSAESVSGICSQILRSTSKADAEIPIAPEMEYYALSHAQKRIYVITQMEKGVLAYNSPSVYKLRGSFKPEVFERAVNSLIERHEAFRTSFHEISGTVKQRISKTLRYEIPVNDYREVIDAEGVVNLEIEAEITKPFDLSEAPLMRIILYRVKDDEYFLYLNIHHIIADGWSIDVIAKELNSIYNAYASGSDFNEKAPELQYKDFALWQNQKITSGEMESQKKYWLEKLSGELSAIDLPIKNARPQFKTYAGKTIRRNISKERFEELEKYSRSRSVSIFAFFTTALKALLHRYTNQEDIIIGSAVAGRAHRSLADVIGLFSNTIALRDQIKSTDTFEDALYKVKRTINESLENQDYPFDLLVEDLALPRATERGALFDIAVVYQHANAEKPNMSGVDAEEYKIENCISKFEALFSFIEEEGGLTLEIDYNSDIYADEFISRIPGHLINLIEQAVAQNGNNAKTIGAYNLLTHRELEEYEEFNKTEFPGVPQISIPELFRRESLENLQNIAVVCCEFQCSYAELDSKSDSIAQFIINKGVSKGEVVALKVRRDERFIISMLGVMKSGAVYLPIDEKTPVDRTKYILKNSAAKLFITSDPELAVNITETDTILLKDISHNLALEVKPEIDPNDISYIIYTSGTTGEPKGIEVTNLNLINTITHQIEEFKLDSSSAVMQFYSSAFDASMLEVFTALFSGAKLVVVENDLKNRPTEFLEYINHHGVTLAFFPPSFLAVLDKSKLTTLKTILTGMEPPIPGDASELSKFLDYYNIYGPTETTVICAFHKYEASTDSDRAIPLGKPMRNYKIYICNDNLELQPKGTVGEICIEGMGVTNGYVGDKILTEEKYVSSPITGKPLFRSGDLGRITEDGLLAFAGRKDKQVKIRGYRIELGEIKTALEGLPGIRESFIDVVGEDSAKELVAYFVSLRDIKSRDIMRRLRQKLPDYMIPGRIIRLDAIPLTNNGKVDKSLLPDPFEFASNGETIKEASTETEKRLVELWRQALNFKNVGVNQNFFMLGGDSIKAIRLIALAKQNGMDFDVKSVFQYPTIEELALHVKEKSFASDQSIVTGIFPLTGIQQWFFEKQPNSINHFNQAFLLKAKEELDYDRLKTAFEEITERHDALRMVFYRKDGSFVQENLGIGLKPELFYYNLTNQENPQDDIKAAANALQSGIDIEKGPLLKAALFHGDDGDRLLIVIHHLVVDGVSWRILLEDLQATYLNRDSGSSIEAPPKTDSFGKWSAALKEYIKTESYALAFAYWKNQSFVHAESIPFDTAFEENTFEFNEIEEMRLSPEETRDLLENSTGINELALAALSAAFHKTFGVERLAVLLEGHGREGVVENVDVSRTIGWFTSAYPVLLDYSEDATPAKTLSKTKRTLAEIPNKGFDYLIIKHLLEDKNVLPDVEPQVSFNYLGQFRSDIDGGIFSGSEDYAGPSVAATAERIQDFIINAVVESDEFELYLSYNRMRYMKSTIQTLLKNFRTELIEFIELSKKEDSETITAADIDVDLFDDDTLDDFLNSL